MKLILSFVINAPKFIPVGEHTAKSLVASAEIELLKELLEKESTTKENLQSLIHERYNNFKDDVLSSQLHSLSTSFIFLALLIVNSLNIIFIVLGFWYFRSRYQVNKKT